MNNPKKRNNYSKIFLNSKFFALLGLTLIVLISFPVARNVSKRYKINKEIDELKKEIQLIEDKNTDLKKFINYLSSEQFAEEQARMNFGLKKPGEEVAVISDLDLLKNENINNNSESIYNIPGLNNEEKVVVDNNARRWFRYFTKK